jgi:hypothetical protein
MGTDDERGSELLCFSGEIANNSIMIHLFTGLVARDLWRVAEDAAVLLVVSTSTSRLVAPLIHPRYSPASPAQPNPNQLIL